VSNRCTGTSGNHEKHQFSAEDLEIARRLVEKPITDISRKRPKLMVGSPHLVPDIMLGPLNVVTRHKQILEQQMSTMNNQDSVVGLMYAKIGFSLGKMDNSFTFALSGLNEQEITAYHRKAHLMMGTTASTN
jgi:hypothetical protein